MPNTTEAVTHLSSSNIQLIFSRFHWCSICIKSLSPQPPTLISRRFPKFTCNGVRIWSQVCLGSTSGLFLNLWGHMKHLECSFRASIPTLPRSVLRPRNLSFYQAPHLSLMQQLQVCTLQTAHCAGWHWMLSHAYKNLNKKVDFNLWYERLVKIPDFSVFSNVIG